MAAIQKIGGNGLKSIRKACSWIKLPFIVGAPMRVMSGPHLALAISRAGGLGFIGPGATPESTGADLAAARDLFEESAKLDTPRNWPSSSSPSPSSSTTTTTTTSSDDRTTPTPQPLLLPVGVGFQVWNGDLGLAARAVRDHRPCAAWLFAPRHGQAELDEWAARLRDASPGLQIWVQIGTVAEAVEASTAGEGTRPDVLVVQGAEAGGHGRAEDGLGIATLFPEVADAVLRREPSSSGVALVAAGGIADGRGVAAALALGADGVAMGTRFLASKEARIPKGYQDAVVRARDGAHSTARTTLYNQLRGTTGWPAQYSPRGILNRSWRDHASGAVPFDELKRLHDEAERSGGDEEGWGPDGRLATYAGAAVGLVNDVQGAEDLVRRAQGEALERIRNLRNRYNYSNRTSAIRNIGG